MLKIFEICRIHLSFFFNCIINVLNYEIFMLKFGGKFSGSFFVNFSAGLLKMFEKILVLNMENIQGVFIDIAFTDEVTESLL